MVSDSGGARSEVQQRVCLNPCFNGIWSRTQEGHVLRFSNVSVLILVLMEYGLELSSTDAKRQHHNVLILVLMEYGFEERRLTSCGAH